MRKSSISNQQSAIPSGFTIIECLIGLAISAVLLTAVAVAFNASIINYRANEDMFWSMNSARQALTRMTSEIRTAGYFDAAGGTWYGMAHSAPTDHCTFYLPNHDLITYEFRDGSYAVPAFRNKLYLIKAGQEYLLCNDVTNATFTTTSNNGVDATGVEISLTVRTGGVSRTLSAAAVLRRMPPGL